MVTLEEVFESLDLNQNLTPEVKGDFRYLATVLNNKFPTFNLATLSNNLKSVKWDTTSSFATKNPFNYDRKNNKITFVAKELSEDYDSKYLMMMCLLELATNRKNDDKYNSINKGVASGLATALVGNEGKELYFDEEVEVDLINCLSNNNIVDAYFQDNYQSFIEGLTK